MGRALRTNRLPTSNGADVSDAIALETLRNLNFGKQTVALDRPRRGVEDSRGDPPRHDCVVRQLVDCSTIKSMLRPFTRRSVCSTVSHTDKLAGR
jgi:hypothetical protein